MINPSFVYDHATVLSLLVSNKRVFQNIPISMLYKWQPYISCTQFDTIGELFQTFTAELVSTCNFSKIQLMKICDQIKNSKVNYSHLEQPTMNWLLMLLNSSLPFKSIIVFIFFFFKEESTIVCDTLLPRRRCRYLERNHVYSYKEKLR